MNVSAADTSPLKDRKESGASTASNNPGLLQLPAKPVWLADLSLSIREGYDDNLYGSGVPPLEGHNSWFTAVSPKIGIDLGPLIGASTNRTTASPTLSLGYAPDLTWYADAGSEDSMAHNFPLASKGQTGAFSWNVENGFRYVDGSRFAPSYTSGYSCYAIAYPRERREQIQDRAKISMRYDMRKYFLRPMASLLYYDLMTYHRNASGYLNYVDRYDAHGGIDFGYKFLPKLAAVVGYRYGHQGQKAFAWDPTNFSNDYHRLLFGLEGSPIKGLKFEGMAGPDFRHYDSANTPATFDGPDLLRVYAEASVSAELTTADALTLKYKRWQWVNSTGRSTYEDNNYELNYKRKLTPQLSLNLGGRLGQADYSLPNVRNDFLYAITGGLRYALSSHLSLETDYSLDLGRNGVENLAAEANRQFNRQIVSLTVRFKY